MAGLQNKHLLKAFETVGAKLVLLISQKLIAKDKKASGELIDKLKFRITSHKKNGLTLRLGGKQYLKYVDEGRKPGNYPPPEKIKAWIKKKGLDVRQSIDSLAFLIGRKISEKGIKPTNVIGDSNKELEKLQKKLIMDALAKDVIASLPSKLN